MHQPAAPSLDLDTLRTIADQLKAVYPDRARRVEKAVSLILFRSIERGDAGRVWWVGSETTPDTTYAVADATCQCMDYQKRGGPCAHQLAVTLLTRIERRETDREQAGDALITLALTPEAEMALATLGEVPDITPLCSRCHSEPAVLSHMDRLGLRCLNIELFGDDAA